MPADTFCPLLRPRVAGALLIALALLGSACSAMPAADDDHNAVGHVLAYADRVRLLAPTELAAEIAGLGDGGDSPYLQLQLALALVQTHQPVDTARALGLAQRVASSTQPQAAPLQPLARLLAARLMEQRRLEDQSDRQGQQIREAQRRIDQLNERLEAMRAIERSLTPRTPRPTRPATP